MPSCLQRCASLFLNSPIGCQVIKRKKSCSVSLSCAVSFSWIFKDFSSVNDLFRHFKDFSFLRHFPLQLEQFQPCEHRRFFLRSKIFYVYKNMFHFIAECGEIFNLVRSKIRDIAWFILWFTKKIHHKTQIVVTAQPHLNHNPTPTQQKVGWDTVITKKPTHQKPKKVFGPHLHP